MDERTPLIHRESPEPEVPEKFPYRQELFQLTRETLPISASFALQNIVQAWGIFVAGKLGTFELEVASYGYMFASCTGSMVAIGGATALDTLCSQVIASEESHDAKLILLLQQGLFVLSSLFLCIIAPLWVWSGRIFLALGQEARFAQATAHFLHILVPAGMLQVVAECLKKYLQVQGFSTTVGWSVCIASVIGVIANYGLMKVPQLGLDGAPLAHIIYHLSTVLLLLFYVRRRQEFKLNSLRRDILDGSKIFIFYAVTGILTVATEWWSFEILAMMAARLDTTSIAAQSILMASDLILTTVSLGLGVASSHRIGKYLGAGNGRYARLACLSPYLFSFLVGLLEFGVLFLSSNVYGNLFTTDTQVVEMTARILPLMAGFQVLDLANGGAGGILRGAGKNHLSGASNFLAYYGVGLTTAWVFCFKKGWGLIGLWAGIILGSACLLVLQTIFVSLVQWEYESEKIGKSSNTLESEEAT